MLGSLEESYDKPRRRIKKQRHHFADKGLYRQSYGLSSSHAWMRRRQWHPTPVLWPGKSHGRRSLMGCSPRGHDELDTTEQLHFHFTVSPILGGLEVHTFSNLFYCTRDLVPYCLLPNSNGRRFMTLYRRQE